MSIFDKEIEIPIDIVSLRLLGFNGLLVKHIHTRVNGVAYKIYEAKILAYRNSDLTWDFQVVYEFECNTHVLCKLTDLHDVEVLIENVKQYIIKKVNSKNRKFPVEITF